MRITVAVVTLFAASCVPPKLPEAPHPPPQLSGAGLLVDMLPANRPALVGALDFELLAGGKAQGCASRGSRQHYWVSIPSIEHVSSDPLTQQAIAAAVTDAIQRLDDVDGIMLTNIVTEAKSADTVCAEVAGRGIRFVKAGAPAAVQPLPSDAKPLAAPPH